MGLFKRGLTKILIFLFFSLLIVIIFFISQSSSKWLFENIGSEEKLNTETTIEKSIVLEEEFNEELIKMPELKIPSFTILLSDTELEQGDILIVMAENVPEGEILLENLIINHLIFFQLNQRVSGQLFWELTQKKLLESTIYQFLFSMN